MTTSTVADYRPSLVGRIARATLPTVQRALPLSVYKPLYDFGYNSYRRYLRWSYLGRLLKSHLAGGAQHRLRARLTMRLLPHTMGGYKALENAFDLVAAAEAARVPGAIVECGVAQGGTAAMMAVTNRELGRARRPLWFFDSYEGLPEPTDEDYENGKAGHFIQPLPKGACLGTIEQVSDLLFDVLEFKPEDVRLVKGWFQDTVPTHRDSVGPIAVLRLDGDWYESTKIPLENFYDAVSPGGYVIVDDYATCFGSRKATDEVRAARRITAPLVADGRGGVWFQKPA